MTSPEQTAVSGTPDQLRFELLVSDIASRFLGMEPRDVDREIEIALGAIREFFDANLCGLFSIDDDGKEVLLTHLAVTADIPMIPPRINYASRAAWRLPKLIRGEVILVNHLDELPPEAEADRRSSEALGIQAYLLIPVSTRGVVHYALHIGFTRQVPEGLRNNIQRLVSLAGVLVTALERNREIAARQELEVRLDLASGLAGTGLWDLDMKTNVFWVTERTRSLYGFGPDETVTLERVLSAVHPDEREELAKVVARAMESPTPMRTEYRVVLPGGVIRWIAASGSRSPEWFGGGNHFLGASIDVTERKVLEEESRRSTEEIRRLNELLEREAVYLRTEIGLTQSQKEIVGKSAAIRTVLRHAEQVAPTDTTVLIVGETGTGKELVARAIHTMGARKDRLMVNVDCASLPSTLIESELFGRERGAYTGALTRQIGRFQLAHRGTLFLDEIGELPRETQAKLLRVLEDGTFQALGDPKTVQVDVRVVAATNRDLAKEVREGRFREDLYFRLNVFPIVVPPLRERREDIPMLVWSFVERFSREMRKEIRRIPKETMDALVAYDWPGNVRELKNLVEQAFILSPGDVLNVRLPSPPPSATVSSQTMEDAERRHILTVLEQTKWRIKGPRGAAARLDLNSSSLYSRMKKLGIPTKREKG